MFIRSIVTAVVVCVSAIPSLADPPKPTVVVTAKALSRLLSEYREMIRHVGGPAIGDQLVMEFDEELKEHLGEQGFEGIDINRPVAAYTLIKEKFEDTNPILIVPITGEKEFIAFLKRIKIETSAVKDKKGLYMLRVRGLDFLPNDSFAQVVNGWAYVGLNGDDVGDIKNRLPIENLFNDADLALFTVKFFPGRFPEKLLKEWLEIMDMVAAGNKAMAGRGGPPQLNKMMQTFFEEGPKLVRRYGEMGIKEVEEIRGQFGWDPNSGDTLSEVTLIPKAGSSLAKDIAGRAATTNRFAGLTHTNAALAAVIKLPLFAEENRAIGVDIIGAMEFGVKTELLPDLFHPFVEELAKSAIQTVKKSDLDAAFALVGPDKNGKFSLVAAVSMVDTSALEKALRQEAKNAKETELAKEFEFDIEKIAGVGIHKIPLGKAVNEEILRELNRAFGEKPPAYIAFAKDAVFITFGFDGLAAIKTAIEAKPGPAPVLEVTGNTSRFHKFVAAVGTDHEAADFAKVFGPEDKQVSLFRVTLEGGTVLKAKVTLNLRHLPRVALWAK